MAAVDEAGQAVRVREREISELKILVKELGEENRDLRVLLDKHGIKYEETISIKRHRRYFARLRDEHPIPTLVSASDFLGVAPAVQRVAECSGSILGTGFICRSFFAAFARLTTRFPWQFGGRVAAALEGHEDAVGCLALLEDGQLASGSSDSAIRVWALAAGTCAATLQGHGGPVFA